MLMYCVCGSGGEGCGMEGRGMCECGGEREGMCVSVGWEGHV